MSKWIDECKSIKTKEDKEKEIEEIEKNKKKLDSKYKIKKATVKVGENIFDACEESQNAMARNLYVMSSSDTIDWKMANDVIVNITKDELFEALEKSTDFVSLEKAK